MEVSEDYKKEFRERLNIIHTLPVDSPKFTSREMIASMAARGVFFGHFGTVIVAEFTDLNGNKHILVEAGESSLLAKAKIVVRARKIDKEGV
jgi:hypothetical protein